MSYLYASVLLSFSFCFKYLFCFLFLFVEVELVYNVMLVFTAQKIDSVIHVYTFFFIFFSVMVHQGMLVSHRNTVPSAMQEDLVFHPPYVYIYIYIRVCIC